MNIIKINNPSFLSIGFSLIELLIVLTIIALLLLIAYPSYHSHLIQSRRHEAATGLYQLASQLEHFASLHNSYQDATLTDLGISNETDDHSYQFIIEDSSTTTYHVAALPQGSQKDTDTYCGSLKLDETGHKTISGTGTSGQCWQ